MKEHEFLESEEITLRCVVCGYGEFTQREAQLNTAVASFFNLDWANESATCYTCGHCGYIHWFLPQPFLTIKGAGEDEKSQDETGDLNVPPPEVLELFLKRKLP